MVYLLKNTENDSRECLADPKATQIILFSSAAFISVQNHDDILETSSVKQELRLVIFISQLSICFILDINNKNEK